MSTIALPVVELLPGHVLKTRTVKGAEVTYIVLRVEHYISGVMVYSLREYDGLVANYDRI